MRKKPIAIMGAVLLLAAAGTGAGAVAIGFADTVSVSFGEVEYSQSELTVTDTVFVGPGNNVETVEVTVNNPSADMISADTSVYLMDDADNTVITEGSSTDEFASDGKTTISVDLGDKTNRNKIDALDIRVQET